MTYTIKLSGCTNTTGGCEGVTLTDTLPTGLHFGAIVSGVNPANGDTVTAPGDDGKLIIKFGETIPSGDGKTVSYTATIDPGVDPGTVLTNQVAVTGTNLTSTIKFPLKAEATVTVSSDPTGGATLTKTWTPTSGLALSGAASLITLDATTKGNQKATILAIAEPATEPLPKTSPFDDVDLTGLIVALPAEITAASATFQLEGTPPAPPTTASCDLVAEKSMVNPNAGGPALSGYGLDDSCSVDLSKVEGVTITIGDGATTIDPGAKATAYLAVKGRTTNRTTSTAIPTGGLTVANTASATSSYASEVSCGSGSTPTTTCSGTGSASYTMTSVTPSVGVTKSGYGVSPKGTVYYGVKTTLTNTITATNTTAGGITSMVVTDDNSITNATDGTTLPNPFADGQINLTGLSWTAPAGTDISKTTITLTFRDGSTANGTVTSPLAATDPLLGTHQLADVAGFSLSFTATTFFESNAAAKVTVTSTPNWASLDNADGTIESNCAQAQVGSSYPTAAGKSTGCSASLNYKAAHYEPQITKTATDDRVFNSSKTLVSYTLQASASAKTAPYSAMQVQDPKGPEDPSTVTGKLAENPFDQLALHQIVTVNVPEGAQLTADYFDRNDKTWKNALDSGTSLGAGEHDNVAFSGKAAANGIGIRFTLSSMTTDKPLDSSDGITVTFDTTLRSDRLSGAPVDYTYTPDTATADNYQTRNRAPLPENCGSNQLIVGDDPSGSVATTANCPVVSFYAEGNGHGLILELHNYWPNLPEQADKATGDPSNQSDNQAYTHVEADVTTPDGWTSIAVTSCSTDWSRAFDLKSVGGPVYTPTSFTDASKTGNATEKALTLPDGVQATIDWLGQDCTSLGVKDQLTDKDAFANPIPAPSGAAGYTIKFSMTDGKSELPTSLFNQYPSLGSSLPKILVPQVHELRASAREGTTDWPSVEWLDATATPGAILAEGNYLTNLTKDLYDKTKAGKLASGCFPADGDGTDSGDNPLTSSFPHTSTRIVDNGNNYGEATDYVGSQLGLCGAIPLKITAKGTFNPAPSEDPSTTETSASNWDTRSPISQWAPRTYNYAQLIDVNVNVSVSGVSLKRIIDIDPINGDVTDDGGVFVPLTSRSPEEYPFALLSGTVQHVDNTAVDSLTATIGGKEVGPYNTAANFDAQLPGIDQTSSLFKYFKPVSLDTLTLSGVPSDAKLTAELYTSSSGTDPAETCSASTADSLESCVNDKLKDDPTLVSSFAGMTITVAPGASTPAGIPAGATVHFELRVQLRDTVDGTAIRDLAPTTVGSNGDIRVDGSDLDAVMNRHASGSASISLLLGERSVGVAAQFVTDTLALDSGKTTTLSITAANNGVTDEDSLSVDVRASSANDFSQLWNTFNLAGNPIITPPLRYGKIQAPKATVTYYTSMESGALGITVELDCSSGTCTGWDGVPLASIRGLSIAFNAADGSVIAPTQYGPDAATIKLPLTPRQTLGESVNKGDGLPGSETSQPWYGQVVTAPITAAIQTGASVSTTEPVLPKVTLTYGHPQISLAKLIAATNGTSATTFLKPEDKRSVTPGTVVVYDLEVSNTGDQALTPLVVTDPLPPGLATDAPPTYQLWNGTDWVTISPSDPSYPSQSYDETTHTLSWNFGARALAPNAKVRILVPLAVTAAATGSVTNTASVDVTDQNPQKLDPSAYCAPPETAINPIAPGATAACQATRTDSVATATGFRIQTLSRGIKGSDGSYLHLRQGSDGSTTLDPTCARTDLDAGYSAYPCAALSQQNGTVSYRLQVQSFSSKDTQTLIVGDLLPAGGDHLMLGDPALFPRGTEFDGQTVVSVPVIHRYDKDGKLLASSDEAEVSKPGSTLTQLLVHYEYCDVSSQCLDLQSGEWKDTDPDNPVPASGLRFTITEESGSSAMVYGDTITVDFDVRVPSADGLIDTTNFLAAPKADKPDSILTSWNSSAFVALDADGKALNSSTGDESSKAGTALNVGKLDVTATLRNLTRVPDSALGDWTLTLTDTTTGSSRAITMSASDVASALKMLSDDGDFFAHTPQFAAWATVGDQYTLVVTKAADGEVLARATDVKIAGNWGTTPTARNSLGVTLVYQPGSLTVSKTVAGAGKPDPAIAYPFTASCTYHGQQILTSAEQSFSLAGGDAKAFDKLPMGTECTVKETGSGTGVVTTPSAVTSAAGWTTTINANNANQTLGVVNAYSTRTLVVTKAVATPAGYPASANLGTFAIDVACTSATEPAAGFTRTLSWTGANTLAFPDLPSDAHCQVSETGHGNASSWSTTGTAGVSVAGDVATTTFDASTDSRTVTITNTFGGQDLAISKKVLGAPAKDNALYSFTASCRWGSQTLTLDASPIAAGGTAHLIIPAGASCQVTEKASGAHSTSWTVDGKAAKPTGIVMNRAHAVVATNEYTTSVTVTKQVKGGTSAEQTAQYVVTFAPLTDQSGAKVTADPVTTKVRPGHPVKVALHSGWSYRVSEVFASGQAKPSHISINGSGESVTLVVPRSGSAAVTVTNTYPASGKTTHTGPHHTQTPSTQASAPPSSGGSGSLAITGADAALVSMIALAMIVAGVMLRRRRDGRSRD